MHVSIAESLALKNIFIYDALCEDANRIKLYVNKSGIYNNIYYAIEREGRSSIIIKVAYIMANEIKGLQLF